MPIVFGPLFDWEMGPRTRLRLDALGVFRSAGDLSDSRSDLGYMLRAEVSRGEVRTVGLGVRAFDVVAPVEDWGLRNAEVGWAAFLFHRDYRDYYLNKGWGARVFAQPERPISLGLEVRREWHTSVAVQDPWTVFRNSDAWRPNPPIDEGHYTTVLANASIDTRNDVDDPTAGWLVRATFENSRSSDVVPHAGVPPTLRDSIPTDGSYSFNRMFVDARHYARISPSGRIHLRLVGGGWMGGDPLPLQRRLSLGGPEPMPGEPFRVAACNGDFLDPAFADSKLAACDRVLAFQTDTTRVCTYIGSTPNGVSYPELGFRNEHHSQTHHNNEPEKVRKVAAITAFNIAQFAYMVKKMHSLREGDGTLLDNCIMMWGSGLEDGNEHTRKNLPFILAGRGGGSLHTGRFLAETRGNQGDLLTTLLTCAGIPLDRPIGIATKQLNEMCLTTGS